MGSQTKTIELAGERVELRLPIRPRVELVRYWYGQHHDELITGDISTSLGWSYGLVCAAAIGLSWPGRPSWPKLNDAGWDVEVFGEGVLAVLMEQGSSPADVTRAGREVIWWLMESAITDADIEEALDPTSAQGESTTEQP